MTAQPLSPPAFNTLILAEQDLLYTLASILMGDERRAETAVQQACQDAYRCLDGSGGAAAREALLACLVKACTPRRNWLGLDHRRGGTPAGGAAQLGDYLEQLPFRSRAAVALVDLAGLTYAETARVLGCTPAQVRSCLASARHTLAQLLSVQIKEKR